MQLRSLRAGQMVIVAQPSLSDSPRTVKSWRSTSGESNFPGGEVQLRRIIVEVAVFSHRSRDGNATRMREDGAAVAQTTVGQISTTAAANACTLVIRLLCTCHYLVARKLPRANHAFRLRACVFFWSRESRPLTNRAMTSHVSWNSDVRPIRSM